MIFVETWEQSLEKVTVIICKAEMRVEHSLVFEGLVDDVQMLGLRGILWVRDINQRNHIGDPLIPC